MLRFSHPFKGRAHFKINSPCVIFVCLSCSCFQFTQVQVLSLVASQGIVMKATAFIFIQVAVVMRVIFKKQTPMEKENCIFQMVIYMLENG